MADHPTWQLERCRPLLQIQLQQVRLDPRLRRRFDSSNVVEEAQPGQNTGGCIGITCQCQLPSSLGLASRPAQWSSILPLHALE
jgi:hypothetical protein